MPLPRTVPEVVDRLRTISASLPPGDGAGVFNRMYLDVTERVATALDAGSFRDPRFMAELDVRFANLWIDAFEQETAGRTASAAWKPLFAERRTAGVLPVQHALAGMNAHIEHDLPVAVVQTCVSRGASPADHAVRHDYDVVNDVLAAVESEVRRSFLTEAGRLVDDEIGPAVHLVSSWNIDKARDVAWVNVETLWAMRRIDLLHDRYLEMLAHTVGMGSRILLTPVARGLVLG